MSKLIVFTGGLATLKTTISKQIAQDLGILCVNKDDIKATLVDVVGFTSREENKKLSVAAVSTMIEIAKQAKLANISIMLEANFKKQELENIKDTTNYSIDDILTIFLFADEKVLYERYVDRQSNRHIAHTSTGLLPFDVFKASLKEHQLDDCIGKVITCDTTIFTKENYTSLIEQIKQQLK